MRKKIMLLLVALAALAGASTGLFSPKPAEAACFTYCCPGTTRCITCCNPRFCELNCP